MKPIELTDAELNELGCKWMGWYRVPVYDWFENSQGCLERKPFQYHDVSVLPNLVGSMDEMAKAEARLTDEEHARFREELAIQCEIERGATQPHIDRRYETTIGRAYQSRNPRQRLIALLKAVEVKP